MPLVLASASFDSTNQEYVYGEARFNFLSFSWQDQGRIIRICLLASTSFDSTNQAHEY
jgi:hypothetical protein